MGVNYISSLFKMAKVELKGEKILEQARNRTKNNITENDCYGLQRFLQGLFYRKLNSTDRLQSDLQKAAAEYLNGYLINKIKTYNFDQNLSKGFVGEQSGKLKQKSAGMFVATIKTRIKQIESQIELIQKNPRLINQTTSTIQEMRQVITAGENLLSKVDWIQYSQIGKQKGAFIALGEDNYTLFNDFINLYNKIDFISSLPSSTLLGQVFEKALGIVGNKDMVDKTTDELIEEFQKFEPQGMQLVDRGSLSNVDGKSIKENPQSNSLDYIVEGYNGCNFEIKGTFNQRQGKLDCYFDNPVVSNKQFRISAKNWIDITDYHNFGKTSIASAILRISSNLDHLLSYGLTMGSSNPVESAHQYAKACLLVDIVMGYSQKEGWVDTLVINNRSKRKIIVKSVDEILKNYSNRLDDKEFSTYCDAAIEFLMSDRLNKCKKIIMSNKNYLNEIYPSLDKYKVQITNKILT